MESAYGFVALVVIVALTMLVRHVRDDRRRSVVSQFAQAQGWTFAAADPALVNRWRGIPFDDGYEREARNVQTGNRNGRAFIAFDYTYVTRGSGRRSQLIRVRHNFGVVAIPLPGALPPLMVEPQNRLIAALGGEDFDLESERFNEAFRVRADDQRFGHAVLHPRLMELLLQRGELSWRIHGDTLLGWARGRHEPSEALWRLDLLAEIADHVPPYVWRDYANVDPRR
ncbi:hypothetical protein [Kribbella deserti]|uniref:DUF3137 domain-containing protein n=1 Tax=Kribbella deserti TaxID=1926257 RepID=A0ABV6QRE6_9ACTN